MPAYVLGSTEIFPSIIPCLMVRMSAFTFAGIAEMHDASVQQYLPFVGLIQPAQDVHERGLACAVFSEKAVNFPLENLEVDPLICRHIWEVLNNPLHQDGGSPVIRSDGHLRLSGRN